MRVVYVERRQMSARVSDSPPAANLSSLIVTAVIVFKQGDHLDKTINPAKNLLQLVLFLVTWGRASKHDGIHAVTSSLKEDDGNRKSL